MKKLLPVVAAAVWLAAVGCGSVGSHAPEFVELPAPGVELTAKESGKTVPLKVGTYAKISLKENPTTGYVWFFKIVDSNGAEVKDGNIDVAGERLVPPQSNLLGAPGIKEVMIVGRRPGRAVLLGECSRPWERGKEPPAVTVKYYFDVTR